MAILIGYLEKPDIEKMQQIGFKMKVISDGDSDYPQVAVDLGDVIDVLATLDYASEHMDRDE